MHSRYQQRRLFGRCAASAEPHQIGSADLERYALDQVRQGDSLVGTDIDGALDLTVEELRKSRPDIGDGEKPADLSPMRAQGCLVQEQVPDDGGHQTIRMLVRAELKKNAAPSARQQGPGPRQYRCRRANR